jgi:chemotaxis response regulator CheB
MPMAAEQIGAVDKVADLGDLSGEIIKVLSQAKPTKVAG